MIRKLSRFLHPSGAKDSARAKAPRLLVSVRSAREATVAWEGGASYIDIKEPLRGSLGSASLATQSEIVTTLQSVGCTSSVIVTAALGELAARPHPGDFSPLEGISLYKLGLSGCGGDGGWRVKLDEWRQCMDPGARGSVRAAGLVAVAYADHLLARSPDPREVLEYAIGRRLSYFLLDTFEKGSGSLPDFYSHADLQALVDLAHQHEVNIVLAGSLRVEDFRPLFSLGPDVLAVRGAACKEGKRELGLDTVRVKELVQMLQHPTPQRPRLS